MISWPDAPNDLPLGDGRFASAADRPASVDELRQAVAARAHAGLAVYPQGGRTALDYGGVPARPGAVLDLRGLDRVVDYPAADMTITVEAGISLATLRGILAAEHQRLVLDAPNAEQATLGGLYATNFSGPRRFGGGRPRDHIIGVAFVNARGERIKGGGRVVKNVAGYDFPKLLTGSLGTLGVLAELTLKVRPMPEAAAIAWAGVPDLAAAGRLLDGLNTSATRPMAIELLNAPAADRVGGHLGLPGHPWVLAVGLEDNAESVAWSIGQLRRELAEARVEVREGEEARPLWSELAELADRECGPLAIQASVPPSQVVGFCGALDPSRWEVQSHAGSGIVRARSIGEWAEADARAVIGRLRAEAARSRGAVTLTRCPADWKPGLKVWGDPRPDWGVAEAVKRALDPGGVMNPGRFIATI